MRNVKFRLKIFTYFTIAAILPSLFLWYMIYHKIDQKLVNDYKQVSYNYVLNHITEVDHFFQKQEDILNTIAEAYTYTEKSPESLSAFIKKQASINSDFLNLYIIRPDGMLISSIGDIKQDVGYTKLNAYIEASRRGQSVWLEPYHDEISGFDTLGIAMPVMGVGGQIEGVIVANLNYSFFRTTIEDIEHLSDSEIFLTDSNGNIKFNGSDKYSKYKNIREEGFILQNAAEEILRESQGNKDISYQDGMWFCTHMAINANDWRVIAVSDGHEILEKINSINRDVYKSITIFGVLMLLFVTVLSLILANSISKPLVKLRDGVNELALGNLDHTITIESNDEIREVAETFNQMSYNLKKSYQDLFSRTEELYEKNENLQEINAELEASYEQLGATMEQLNVSEEKYRKLVNNISDMVVVLNIDAEIVYVNSTVVNILRQPESQLIGRNIREVLRGDLKENTLKECFANDYHEFQLRLTNLTNQAMYFEGSTRRLVENGNVVGIQSIIRDITQRKMMEDELRARYKELQAINEVTNAVTKTLDLDEMMQIVAEQVTSVTQGLCCIVGLYDENNEFILKAAHGIKLRDINEINVESTKNETIRLIGNKTYFIMEDKSEETLPNDYHRILFREEGYRFTLFHPIVSHGRHIGLMSTLLRSKPSPEMIELVTSMSNNIALSIDNAKAYESVKTSYLKTVQSLVSAIEAKDMYTESHSARVAKYATFIASEMMLDKSMVEDIWVAGVLHDIGKIGISDSILNKKGKLTPEEYDLIKQHPSIAHRILSNIGLSENIMSAVRHHHERPDGRGYPDGLTGESICLMAAIISAADAFDAITSERSYRTPKSIEEGMAELIAYSGTQFNPQVVDAFQKAFAAKAENFYKIRNDEEINFF